MMTIITIALTGIVIVALGIGVFRKQGGEGEKKQ